MKRALLLIAVILLCVGQSFGPKIVKGPMPSVAVASEPIFYGTEFWWISTNIADGAVTDWIDQIQARKLTAKGGNNLSKDSNGISFDGSTANNNLTNGTANQVSGWTTNFALSFIISLDPGDGTANFSLWEPEAGATFSTYYTYNSGWFLIHFVHSQMGAVIKTNDWIDVMFFQTNALANKYSSIYTNGVLGWIGAVGNENYNLKDFGYITGLGINSFKGRLREIIIQTNMIAIAASIASSNLHYYRTNTY